MGSFFRAEISSSSFPAMAVKSATLKALSGVRISTP
jgi:hypothetical protein